MSQAIQCLGFLGFVGFLVFFTSDSYYNPFFRLFFFLPGIQKGNRSEERWARNINHSGLIAFLVLLTSSMLSVAYPQVTGILPSVSFLLLIVATPVFLLSYIHCDRRGD